MKKHIQVGGQKDFAIKPKIMVSVIINPKETEAFQTNVFLFSLMEKVGSLPIYVVATDKKERNADVLKCNQICMQI